MQVILGAGGAIGAELAKALKQYTSGIRLVGRNPQKVNADDELFAADLTNARAVTKAVEGAEIAYLTVGLPYKTKVWQKQWPVIIKNVITACKQHQCKLVFFDNIYMYAPNQLSPMTEETEVNPPSKKGKVRAKISQMVLDEIEAGTLEALIARSADFYGPGINNSVLNEMVFKNFKAGKKANWFCDTCVKHNFTFTPDAAKATALLGNTEDAYGTVWHLPTAEPITGEEWINAFAKELGTPPKSMVVTKSVLKVLGFFFPTMKEFIEMLYQYNRDYDFDSSKFETVFKSAPTPIREGIKRVVEAG